MLGGSQRGRFYLHTKNLGKTYGPDPRKKAEELWRSALIGLQREKGLFPYVLGIFFAYKEDPVLDLFVPKFENISFEWGEGPFFQAFQYHSAEFSRHPAIFACSDSFLILAEEEKYRRKTRNLEHYLAEAPHLPKDLVKFSF